METINGVKIFQTIEKVWKICVWVFHYKTQKEIDEKVKVLFERREVQFINF